jgi:hypothetical protein
MQILRLNNQFLDCILFLYIIFDLVKCVCLAGPRDEHEDLVGVHDGADADSERLLRHRLNDAAEEARVRQNRVLCQGLYARPGRKRICIIFVPRINLLVNFGDLKNFLPIFKFAHCAT